MTTASSNASSSGSARRVTPLYNLGFHSILPTTISDAGTDQRVAKYSRRGVELDGFGVLEPAELQYGVNDMATIEANGAKGFAIPPATNALVSAGSDPGVDVGKARLGVEPPTSFDSMTPEAQSPDEASLGSKIARRFKGLSFNGPKGGGNNSGAPPSIAGGESTQSGTGSLAPSISTFLSGLKRQQQQKPASTMGLGHSNTFDAAGSSARGMPNSASTMNNNAGNHHAASHDVTQLVAGAGLGEPGGRRTQGYVWTVDRLSRRMEGGPAAASPNGEGQNPVLKNVWRRFNTANRLGADERHPPVSEIPIRFEWTRQGRSNSASLVKSSEAASRSGLSEGERIELAGGGGLRRGSAGSLGQKPTASQNNDDLHSPAKVEASNPSRRGSRSKGTTSAANVSADRSPRASDSGHSTAAGGDGEDEAAAAATGPNDLEEDEGDMSDPEDSETPWSCHLVLGASTRIPIGTLRPAPHHPKVVAQLAVPFPLPDLSQSGLGSDGAGLSREEIKDVICVTCLHLIIRESFGGLGRVKRRGDRA